MPIGKIQPIPPPGRVVDLASKFSPALWEQVSKVRAPSPEDQKGSYGYWFNYFWEEAVTAKNLGSADKAKLCETLLSVFEADGSGEWKIRADFRTREDYWKLRSLRNLLHIGFERVPYEQGPKSQNKNFAGDARALFAEKMALSDSPGAARLHIGWRGDGRDYATLQQQGGFKARARQDKICSEFGLDKPWHPYSLAVYREAIFLRKGHNVDNCLHTAVSVGTDFKMLVHFPIVTDASLYTLPAGPIESWTGGEAASLLQKYKIRVGKDQYGKFLEHDTQIYAVWITDNVRGFHTENFQAKQNSPTFPERSVQEIPVENILARVIVARRYWWDTSSKDRKAHGWQLFDVEAGAPEIVGEDRLKRLGGPAAVIAMRTHAIQKVSEAKMRGDISGDRSKRIRTLSQPQAQGPTQARPTLKCPTCGATAANQTGLKFHMKMAHGQG